MTRAVLETDWLDLTRSQLPALARIRDWPVRADHCFQRILLDAVHGGRWYDFVSGRPAYRHMSEARLADAGALAKSIVRGETDLRALNGQSLAWRGAATLRWSG